MDTLVYDPKADRWQAVDSEGNYRRQIHCGCGISIQVNGTYLQARVEFDTAWYVMLEDTRFHLHPRQRYKVIF
jgi:hypothetical protein